MLQPRATGQFKRDRKLAKKRGKDLSKLHAVMDLLIDEQRLDPRYRLHPLRGKYQGHWECHLEPDWLLVWYTTETSIVFVRTGTHADLFGE